MSSIIKNFCISVSTLYLVPTPIGNLSDITYRALYVLRNVDIIAAENIRHTSILLKNFNIKKTLLSLNEHNEKKKINIFLSKLREGKSIALVSDAGTPLINDPGYHIVRSCREEDIRIVPLPGACAAITALSVSGLPSNRFCYEGFLPTTRKKRLYCLESLKRESRTLIFYESTHRIIESMQDMVTIFGQNRYIVLARELTKTWESIIGAQVGKLLLLIKDDKIRSRGEIVLIVKGYNNDKHNTLISPEVLCTLKKLKSELTIKKAITLTAEIYNLKKNILYRYMLEQYKNK